MSKRQIKLRKMIESVNEAMDENYWIIKEMTERQKHIWDGLVADKLRDALDTMVTLYDGLDKGENFGDE